VSGRMMASDRDLMSIGVPCPIRAETPVTPRPPLSQRSDVYGLV
jgi:hypothetical protein